MNSWLIIFCELFGVNIFWNTLKCFQTTILECLGTFYEVQNISWEHFGYTFIRNTYNYSQTNLEFLKFFINNMNFWLIIFWGSFWVNILFGTLWNVSNNSATFWNIFLECLLILKSAKHFLWAFCLPFYWEHFDWFSKKFPLACSEIKKQQRNKQRMAGLQLMFACNVDARSRT